MNRTIQLWLAAFSTFVLVVGCGDDATPPPRDAMVDTTTPPDATPDVVPTDVPTDTGVIDTMGYDIRLDAPDTYTRVDRAGMPAVSTALITDKNAYLKMTTVLALGYFRNDAAVAPIIEAFKKEKNKQVKAIMCSAMGYIVDVSNVPVLKEVATDFNYLLHYPSIDLVLRLY